MARIRTFKPEFFRHDKLQELEVKHPGAYPMFVFEGLWSICDKQGVFVYKPRQIKLDILPFLPFDMSKTLDILVSSGFVIRFSADGDDYGYIPTFWKHQNITGTEAKNKPRYPSPPKNADGIKEAGNRHEQGIDEDKQGDQEREREREKERESKFNAEKFPESPPKMPDGENPSTADAVVLKPPDNSPLEGTESAAIPQRDPDSKELPLPQSKPLAFSPVYSPPKGRKKLELTPEQNELYHAAKACFESSGKAKAIIYQDNSSSEMQMKKLKEIIVRCSNIAPGITVDFMKSVLEHFRTMTNSAKYKGSWVFTPRCLSTYWIWEIVISSLPERETELDQNIQESIKGLFNKRGKE
jgi:hypothetical protein